MATCGAGKRQNCSLFGMPYEMHGASFSFVKQNSAVTYIYVLNIVLTLRYFCVQASNKVGSLKKALPTVQNIYTLAAAVTAMFSKTTE